MTACLTLGLALFLGACTTTPAPADPEAATADPAAEIQSPPPAGTSPAVTGEPIAVLVGEEFGDYLALSYVFAARLARPYRVYELGARNAEQVVADVLRLKPRGLIALGPSALALAARLEPSDVVFAGVPAGMADGMPIMDGAYRGVDALPPFDLQLDYWRTLDPSLGRLGVIASVAMRDRVAAIAAACATRGLTLEHREVRSDREMLLAFRSMVPRIDGFVILPDAGILSPDVIRRMIVHGRSNGLDLLVYSPLMYELGASILVQAEPVDVASQIVALVHSGERARSLTRMQTRTRLGTVAAAEHAGG